MKILAVDSSGITASVAVYIDGVVTAVNSVNNNKTHSQTLLPMIEHVMKQADINVSKLDAIAVAEGPGSFTGLRIGAATVKGLSFATGKPIIPVST
ncbi:MAG: tRNA (adenosine(37)-N6)-threonylcarbamoyltransferase complex dimerization subunit type 1 TsaB, partial [Lachnospiraceae bacterium]|nr:tRNA (adenosine(37)-N6)-threonylcarbamoyltransferase complex dimerization subunit type 1 TsaB [Lachnospiraceae bacterium]